MPSRRPRRCAVFGQLRTGGREGFGKSACGPWPTSAAGKQGAVHCCRRGPLLASAHSPRCFSPLCGRVTRSGWRQELHQAQCFPDACWRHVRRAPPALQSAGLSSAVRHSARRRDDFKRHYVVAERWSMRFAMQCSVHGLGTRWQCRVKQAECRTAYVRFAIVNAFATCHPVRVSWVLNVPKRGRPENSLHVISQGVEFLEAADHTEWAARRLCMQIPVMYRVRALGLIAAHTRALVDELRARADSASVTGWLAAR